MTSRRATQTLTEPPHGNALQACVATVLGRPLADVPNFVAAADYWQAMLDHARTLGLGLMKVPLGADGALPFASTPGAFCIARGTSVRGNGHVVVGSVAADGVSLDVIHDVHPDGGGLVGAPVWAAFYVAAEPSAAAAVPAAAAPGAAHTLADAPAVRALTARLAPALRSKGFDLLAPFQVGAPRAVRSREAAPRALVPTPSREIHDSSAPAGRP